ncbi:MAG: protein kinase [Phycisphaerales bacterium]|nr:protein kinase [Phycisphaerales bacterium]
MEGACLHPQQLAEYAARSLPPEQVDAVERHLCMCRACLDGMISKLPQKPLAGAPDCHVVAELGRGSAGVVYKAWWMKDTPRLIALKILSGGGDMGPSRFDREIAVLRKLNSPWIVRCLEAGGTDTDRYFIMDYVHGEHLDAYLSKPGRTLPEKLHVFEQVCRAVSHAHALGVVHRDLKPRNILVTPDGRPHILDFGICSVSAAEWTTGIRATITHTGAILGTIKYMSPEQAWGGVAGPIDHRADLWSLGVILHEILTEGGHPFPLTGTPEQPAVEAVLDRIRRELPQPARLGNVPRGSDLETLVERCLTREPHHRLSDAGELADDLDRYCRGERVRTRPHGVGYRLSRVAVGAATRSRGAFWASFVAGTAAVWWIAVLVFRAGWFVTVEPSPGATPQAALAADDADVRDAFLVLGVGDETIAAVVDWARAQGFGNVTEDLRTWRGVHGVLMEHLATAAPRIVVWDYWFRSEQPGDRALAAGINALERAGTPVVLSSMEYDPAGAPMLSPALTGALETPPRHGGIVARDMVLRPGEFCVATRLAGGRTTPGIFLTALAALRHPDARVEVELLPGAKCIDLYYEVSPGAYLRGQDRIETTRTFTPDTLKGADQAACVQLQLQRPQQWAARTLPYEWALNADEDELRSRVEGRMVIIGNLRTAGSSGELDRHAVKYGGEIVRDAPGCYLLADGVAGLIEQRFVRGFQGAAPYFPLILGLALLGCLAPSRAASRTSFDRDAARRWATAVLGAVSIGGLVLTVSSHQQAVVLVGMGLFALTAPMLGAFHVEFARNRYRILDRRRAALDAAAEGGTATATWMPRPRTSR